MRLARVVIPPTKWHLHDHRQLSCAHTTYAPPRKMLALVQAITLSNQAPVVQQSRLSRSRVTAQPTAGVERLRGGADGKCDVILVGCGVPKRGMGWYHGKQMLEGDVPSATMTAVVEPWFLGAGGDSPPGKVFQEWATDMEKQYGTKFVKDISELEIKVRHRARPNPRTIRRACLVPPSSWFTTSPPLWSQTRR